MRQRWIPYPMQNNVWRLPESELLACLDGLLSLHTATDAPAARPASFEEWLLATFGRGLCDVFMFPYNNKVWAHPPRELDVCWMGDRVAPIDLRRIIRNVVLRKDDISWGPNAKFRFPLRGGTGAIWRAVSQRLPAERMHFGRQVTSVNMGAHVVTFSDGERVTYDSLISSIPLDRLVAMLEDGHGLSALEKHFLYSSTHIVGVGMTGSVPPELSTKCWIYFPEPDTPFFRTTVFSNYSPNNVARPGEQWSLMGEISESAVKPVEASTVVGQTIEGYRRCGFIDDPRSIVTRYHRRLEYGYPTPWLGRDEVLGTINQELEANGILSRGRFGAWKYEVSNQDHSTMQGVEAASRIIEGSREYTYDGDMKDWLLPGPSTSSS
jgi:protoporphyrinogen oxidase